MRMADRIRETLAGALAPAEVTVTDDSGRHAGHAGNPDGAGETHFSVEVVSPAFAGLSRVARHRRVTDLLAAEFERGLHALQLKLRAPGE
ncbi:BolA family protein [Zavarzinia compransoris]|uniref:BolA family transcriptional regulator n=1 Tax=Zavarzinia compransoris TaxID=1264899 RepID=A0A317E532_9PROT|nr:BolA family protein [Zavarzinia compransoris]PWR20105.1 BolA family transcriptional regulator [Zavarzinia compransoris]TDP45143.1 BolA protein [Zavarzinia compransoris]